MTWAELRPGLDALGPVERVVAALETYGPVRRSGAGWSARCPAHDDQSPSLSVAEGDDRPVVLHCHAGCDSGDVLDALGLSWADLGGRDVAPRTGDRAPTAGPAQYVYRDAEGRPVGMVVRKAGKVFGQKHLRGAAGGEYWASGGCDALNTTPYNLPEIIGSAESGAPVYVVEGERDVETARALGLVATCNAGGAGKWRAEHSAYLRGRDAIVLQDRDERGQEHGAGVAESLRGIARSVRVVESAAGKDLTDHVHAGLGVGDLVDVADGGGTDLIERYPVLDWRQVWAEASTGTDWLVPGVIENGRSHALASPAKAGKSLVVLDLCASLATGRDLLGMVNPRGSQTVLYVDMENSPADLRERLDAMGYRPEDLDNLRYLSFASLPPLDTARGGAHLLALAEHHRPALIVLDTVSRVVAGKENDSDTFRALYRHTGQPLKRAGYTVLRLDHEGKNPEAGQRGSSAKGDDVDTVWRLHVRGDVVTLRVDRQRSGHHPQMITLRRHSAPGRLWHERTDVVSDRGTDSLAAHLDRLGVPADAGRDVCRAALTEAGVKAGNDALAAAIRGRKHLSEPRRTGASADDQVKITNTCPGPQSDATVVAGQTCPGQVQDRSDSTAAVPEGRPVRPTVPPGGGQVEDGGPDLSGTGFTDDPTERVCDVCGARPAVTFLARGATRCRNHNPMTLETTHA